MHGTGFQPLDHVAGNLGRCPRLPSSRAVGARAGEAGINVGGSPTRRIGLFPAQEGIRAEVVRPGRKQNVIEQAGRNDMNHIL